MTPEEIELKNKILEIQNIEREFIQKELLLVTLQAKLHLFKSRYMETVGVRLAILDDLDAQIAELIAQNDVGNLEAERNAKRARIQAEDTSNATQNFSPRSEYKKEFNPSETIKLLYREAAKRIHPDLANDERNLELRTKLMAEINAAYKAGNEKEIRRILNDWEESPETIIGEDIGAKIIKAIRKLALIKKKISRIDDEIYELENSDLSNLRKLVLEANLQKRDLIKELVDELDQQIAKKQTYLSNLLKGFSLNMERENE